MHDPKKNIIVFCEDEPEIYNAYLTITRKLGLKTPFAPTDPATIADQTLEDGQVFLFKNYIDAERGIDALSKRKDCRVVAMVVDQVLDPATQSYLSMTGHFGSALIHRYKTTLEADKTQVALRTAEEGDILHVLEEMQTAKFSFRYLLKRMDPDCKQLIKFLIPCISRATGKPVDELNAMAETIDLSPSGQIRA